MKYKKLLGITLAACTLLAPMGVVQAGEEPAEVAEDFEPTEGAPLGTIAVDPALREMGLYGAIIGKAYYTGAVRLEEAVREAQ